jgi:glycerol-3-phosphate dehydrogenase
MEVFGKDDVSRLVPALKDIAPHGAFSWHDLLLLDHAGFVLALRKELEQLGGVVRTNSRVIELAFDKRWTVMTKDGDKVRAPVVINASGPWCTELLPKQAPSHFRQIPAGWCAALNLEFDFSLDSAAALACQSQSGRLLFLVPRGEGAALGTWYYPRAQLRSAEVLERPVVLDTEIEKFIEEARVAFKDDRFERSRVRHIDVGVLPMKRCGAQGPELYGRHVVRDWKGFIHLVSTKYTTFRLLGEEAIQAAAPYLRNL